MKYKSLKVTSIINEWQYKKLQTMYLQGKYHFELEGTSKYTHAIGDALIQVKLVTPLLKLMFIMLSKEVCMFVSNACQLHIWHHDVMLSHSFCTVSLNCQGGDGILF